MTSKNINKKEVITYLGNKGYSIYKEKISIKDQQWLRTELLIRPYIPKSPVQPEAFPIYLESPKKLYIPRFFGLENYGEPDEIKISEGDDINIRFKGELRAKDVLLEANAPLSNHFLYHFTSIDLESSLFSIII